MRRIGLLAIAAACSSSMQEPPPLSQLATEPPSGRSATDLVREADAAFARRDQPNQAATAQRLYLDAAAADETRVDGLLGAMRAISYRIEHEQGAPRADLAKKEVELGQWCRRRAPNEPECDYRLALALGQQARERPSTGMDAIGKMVDLLKRAIKAAPRIDSAGPHRVLALVYLRAPSWPLGPGDTDAGLVEARAAVQLFPDAPQNQLAFGEALAATGKLDAGRAAYEKALALATAAQSAGDPEGAGWVAEARDGLARTRAR